jgi:uncharacterized protein (TIGR03437 family)
VTYANNGNPVSLASVVAITASGQAVSALTDPAGNYRIDGLPLNLTYSVYVHPLPPDAIAADDSGLRTPMDPNGARFNAGGPFQTTFFAGPTGTLDPRAAAQFSLIATQRAFTDVNFTVQPRASVPTYNVQVYSRLTTATRTYGNPSDADGVTISDYPGFIDSTQTTGLVIARAAAPAILPVPQSVTVLGGFATATLNNPVYPSILPYSNRPGDFIAIYFSVPQGAGTGPRHMVFNFGNDIYVLPVGVDVVRQGPPAVTAAAQNPDGTVTVAGAGLGNDSRVFFDGLQSTQGTLNPDGSLTVTPPPGATGQAAAVTVYNSDGQNSTILPGTVPPTYTYSGASGAPQIVSISPNSIPAGTSAMVDINVANMNFVDGQVTIGFGSDDVQVLRVWVVNPTHAVADVWVQAGATAGLTEVTALSGMQAATLSNAFQIQSPRAAAPAIASIVNNDSSQPNITPGAIVVINGQNLATSFGSVQLALNDTALQPAFVSTTQVAFVVPPAFPVGPATLKFTSSGALSTYTLQIDGPAPQITGVATQAGTPLAGAVATVGDVLNLTVSNLDPAVVANRQSRLRVTVGGMEMTSQQVTPAGAGVYQIQITLNQSFASSQVPLTVVADGLSSAPVGIIVR